MAFMKGIQPAILLLCAFLSASSQAATYKVIAAYGYTTAPYKINSSGTIVGIYGDGGPAKGFVMRSDGEVTTLAYPGAAETLA
jgi:hypothetical protein